MKLQYHTKTYTMHRKIKQSMHRLGCHARARQVAAVERINVLVPESLRERVDLLQAERGAEAPQMPLHRLTEIWLWAPR